MDYKQKYEEALEREKMYQGMTVLPAESMIETIFPELTENEDEKIRKWLINLLGEMQYHHCDDEREMGNKALAWLEKQGDNNAKWSDKEELHIKQLESLVKKVWAIAEHEDDKDTIREMSDLSFFLKTLNPEKKGEKSHAWSEEDEEMYQNIHECLKNGWRKLPTDLLKCESWFKSLKQRIGGKV